MKKQIQQEHYLFEYQACPNLVLGLDWGKLDTQKGSVLVEFVSSNPTGPLHVGHGRGAILGMVLSNLLENSGYQVTKEYYVNDAGRQIAI